MNYDERKTLSTKTSMIIKTENNCLKFKIVVFLEFS